MRSAVVLPQPDGPDEHHELAVLDVEAEVVHGTRAVGVDLRYALERHTGHRMRLTFILRLLPVRRKP